MLWVPVWLICWGVIACQHCLLAEEAWLRTADSLQRAELTGWDEAGPVFASGQGPANSVPAQRVIRYGHAVPAREGGGVLLVDGSVVTGRVIKASRETVDLVGPLISPSIPAGLVRGMMVRASGSFEQREAFVAAALSATGGDDEIFSVDGDRTRGTLVLGPNGYLHGESETRGWRMRQGESDRAVLWERTRGVIFSPLLTPLVNQENAPDGVVWVGLSDGSRLLTKSISRLRTGLWRFRLVCGIDLVATATDLRLDDIVMLAAERPEAIGLGRLQRVDGLSSLRRQTIPPVGPPEVEAGTRLGLESGQWLSVEGRVYRHVVLQPAASQLVVRLPQGDGWTLCTQLDIAAGELDPRGAAVEFRVLGVDAKGATREMATAVVRRRERDRGTNADQPRLEIPLSGMVAIILEVRRGAGTLSSPGAVWIDPVLMGP